MPDTWKRIWLMELGPRRAGGSIDAVIWVDPAENPEDASVAYVRADIADEVLAALKGMDEVSHWVSTQGWKERDALAAMCAAIAKAKAEGDAK